MFFEIYRLGIDILKGIKSDLKRLIKKNKDVIIKNEIIDNLKEED